MDDEIYVTGRFKGTHTGDLYTPLSPVAASGKGLDLLFVDYFPRWQTKRLSSARSFGTGWE